MERATADFNAQLGQLSQHAAHSEQKVASLVAQLATADQQVRALQQESAQLRLELTKVDQASGALGSANGELAAKLASVQAHCGDQQARIEQLESEWRAKHAECERLGGELASLAGEHKRRALATEEAARAECDELRTRAERAEAKLDKTSNENILLQRKLCNTLIDKENIYRDLIDIRSKHEQEALKQCELQMKTQSLVEQFQARLADEQQKHREEREALKAQLSVQQSVRLSESLFVNLDHQIDESVQSRMEELMRERQAHLEQIDKLKAEVRALTTLAATSSQEQSGGGDPAVANKTLAKQAKEIKRLRDSMQEMQSTNDFLSQQITNLNEQIYDLLSDKENGDNQQQQANKSIAANKCATPSGSSAAAAAAAAAADKQKPKVTFTADDSINLRKVLLANKLIVNGSNSTQTTPLNADRTNAVTSSTAANGTTTPTAATAASTTSAAATTSSSTMTPTTRKAQQCAQQ